MLGCLSCCCCAFLEGLLDLEVCLDVFGGCFSDSAPAHHDSHIFFGKGPHTVSLFKVRNHIEDPVNVWPL